MLTIKKEMIKWIYLRGKSAQGDRGLEITYKNNKIRKICTDAKIAEKTYGTKMAEKIDMP